MKLLNMNGLAHFWSRIQAALAKKADLIDGKVSAGQLEGGTVAAHSTDANAHDGRITTLETQLSGVETLLAAL